jgi:hypothetical protein
LLRALFGLSVTRRPGDQEPTSLLRKASKAFRHLRDVFEDDLEQQGYTVFGKRLSFDLKLEKDVLGDTPQDQYCQTGGAIGIARDREPPSLPKTTQAPSQKAPSGTKTKPLKGAGHS